MPDVRLDLTQLTARAAQVVSEAHQLAYAHVDDGLRIVQVSPNFPSELAD
ncbi:MAG: hypothetical protein HGA79_08460, partial [Anaerolineales bacterium]|nr:hypothetical protein [Anaerolineales bacterium]